MTVVGQCGQGRRLGEKHWLIWSVELGFFLYSQFVQVGVVSAGAGVKNCADLNSPGNNPHMYLKNHFSFSILYQDKGIHRLDPKTCFRWKMWVHCLQKVSNTIMFSSIYSYISAKKTAKLNQEKRREENQRKDIRLRRVHNFSYCTLIYTGCLIKKCD